MPTVYERVIALSGRPLPPLHMKQIGHFVRLQWNTKGLAVPEKRTINLNENGKALSFTVNVYPPSFQDEIDKIIQAYLRRSKRRRRPRIKKDRL